ncbi:hypothetical protein [Microcystis panniformis]|uniref:Uncharacterized protein n=1 Tax=Microcystis panniformis FACHB-1757 TaxID=1638788 RepID=A0A0K1S3U1_9CHRO|nr:hypothetical protein [Microcystis panniformis]AKV68663.1 hypothetical protein VL20_3673 [Microcystis panniformis FACHB-1757]
MTIIHRFFLNKLTEETHWRSPLDSKSDRTLKSPIDRSLQV